MATADFLETRLQASLRQMFGELDDASIAGIRSLFEWVDLPGGANLFHQGSEGSGMYILISGRLRVLRHRKSGRVESFGIVMPGEPVGEMALILGEPRSADVMAMRDSVLAQISADRFETLIHLYPRGLTQLTKTMVERMRRSMSSKRVKKRVTNICILPVSELPDRDGFIRQFCDALEAYGSVCRLDSEAVNAHLGEADVAQTPPGLNTSYRKLISWLDEQEITSRYVVYIPDRQDTEWTRRCIRQSDEVLLVGEASQPPGLDSVERRYLHGAGMLTTAGQSLALLYPSGTRQPSGAAAWVAPRNLKFHHHIRAGFEPDYSRLARFISGNAVGLVLSGGGAKGFAHIGVFRALEEAGITIDMVGGTSIGAILGAQIARGSSGPHLKTLAKEIFRKSPTTDFNFVPRVSIFKGRKLEFLLEETFGELEIEDLWLNFFCVSCNLTKNYPYVHRNGPLTEALRATISIPGVFPPAEFHGELYVDGGVFNNMPVDIMSQLGAGTIIAVDLQVYQTAVPGPLRRSYIFRRKRRMPNLLSIVMESSMLSGRYMAQEHKKEVDLYFNPPLRGIRIIDWHKFDKIESIGYNHAKEVLSTYKTSNTPII
jgi:predicted acylesterase/phospholipase RssA/CRP-like cAMP-binding protein